jgi:hypothetical protein
MAAAAACCSVPVVPVVPAARLVPVVAAVQRYLPVWADRAVTAGHWAVGATVVVADYSVAAVSVGTPELVCEVAAAARAVYF